MSDRPIFRLDVRIPEGMLNLPAPFVAGATKLILDACYGDSGDVDLTQVMVFICEIPDGFWGGGGRAQTLERIRDYLSGALVFPETVGVPDGE